MPTTKGIDWFRAPAFRKAISLRQLLPLTKYLRAAKQISTDFGYLKFGTTAGKHVEKQQTDPQFLSNCKREYGEIRLELAMIVRTRRPLWYDMYAYMCVYIYIKYKGIPVRSYQIRCMGVFHSVHKLQCMSIQYIWVIHMSRRCMIFIKYDVLVSLLSA